MARFSGEKQKQKKMSLSKLMVLNKQLLSSKSNINNLPIILKLVSPSSPPQLAVESMLTLQSFFSHELPSSKSPSCTTSQVDEDPEITYKTWIRFKFDDFISSLFRIYTYIEGGSSLRQIALDAVMEFVKLGNDGKFQSAIYHKLLQGILHSAENIEVLWEPISFEYLKYVDVRYFTYISVGKLSKTLKTKGDDTTRVAIELDIQKLYYILSHIPLGYSESNTEMLSELGVSLANGDFSPSSRFARRMKLKFTKAWLGFLKLPLPLDVYKEVLVSLDHLVVPHISNPAILSDFLTRSYDIGGLVSVMALSSLYLLMTQHGLEYPNFYEKLYALLAPSIFMAKHRDKFFQLLDSCLKSPLLPAYLAASFMKKLSRLTLSAPPSGAIVVIALIHNLLRRHPSINFLVHHQDDADDGSEIRLWKDEFRNEEPDPLKTNAMKSSLWEIDTLKHHYCPPVSSFVSSLKNDLTVRAKTSEFAIADYSGGSYGTIFREEMRRRVKRVPLAIYKQIPTCLFSEFDFPGWSFKWNDDDQSPKDELENRMSVKRPRVLSS